jgi:hypothetical protein
MAKSTKKPNAKSFDLMGLQLADEAEMTVKDITGKPTDIKIRLASIQSDDSKRIQRENARIFAAFWERIAKLPENINKPRAEIELTDEQREELEQLSAEGAARLVVGLTRGWGCDEDPERIPYGGEFLDFTEENVARVYTELPMLFKQADSFVMVDANFTRA